MFILYYMTMIDLLVVVITVFIVSVLLLFSSYLLDEISKNEIIQESHTAYKQINKTRDILFMWDDWMPYLIIGLVMAVVIGAYFIETHPVFFVVSLGMLVLFILMSDVFMFMYDEFANSDMFSGVVNNFLNLDVIWNNMAFIILIAGAIILIVLYAKRGGGFGGPSY